MICSANVSDSAAMKQVMRAGRGTGIQTDIGTRRTGLKEILNLVFV